MNANLATNLVPLGGAAAVPAELRAALAAPQGGGGSDVRAAASRFEEIFVQQVVAAMRQSADGIGEGMFGASAGNDTYAAWFDRHMAEHLAHNGGIGLAAVIERSLQQNTHAEPQS